LPDIAKLRKSDRSRIGRRLKSPEDGLDRVHADHDSDQFSWLVSAAAISLWAGTILGGIVYAVFAATGWATGLWRGINLIVLIACMCCGISYVAFADWRRRPSREALQKRRLDEKSDYIDEITFEVLEAKAFRDPEHGVLSYFLKLSDGRVYFDCFDSRIPDDGWQDRMDNFAESELPSERLHLLYGTTSGDLVHSRMSGHRLQPISVNVLKGNPDYWPSPGTFRKTKWDDIEDLFAA
jgi:hypothetical protein